MYKTESRQRKSPLLLIILTFLFLTLACNLPRSLVDRDDLLCEESGGEVIYPKDGQERYCKYPDDQGNADESMQQDDEVSEEKNNSSVGTYICEMYVNDEPPPGGDDWEYEFESDFSIKVANDGTVTGFKIYKIWVDSVSATGCATRSEEGYTTNVSGFLEGNQGSAILEDKGWSFWEYHGEECGDGKDYFKEEEGVREAIITVSGNQMEISYQGQVIYTLTKE